LAELQKFLERGFTAFAALGGADRFLAAIAGRETELAQRLFAGVQKPFDQPNSSSK
jgi:hypothetical protein